MKLRLALIACAYYLCISVPLHAQRRKNQVLIPSIQVIDTPSIVWSSYPKDTVNVVPTNIQTLAITVFSRLKLFLVEIKINGITSDVYGSDDFSAPVAPNRFEQNLERTVTLRTGMNTITVVVRNNAGITSESSRRVLVDPTQISMLRSERDKNAPMIYISNPTNIGKNDRVTMYEDLIKLSGTVIDESGIQELRINGSVVPVKTNGSFTVILPMNVGDNPVSIEAKDLNQNISLKKFVIERRNLEGAAYDFKSAKNYLVAIGIDDYSHWSRLNNAVSDVKGIVNLLTSQYTFDSVNVELILNQNATRHNIFYQLRKYIEIITPGDNLIIYYSGHGYFDKLLNEGYWVPIEAPRDDLSGFISNDQILKIIENINSHHTLLIADACFSGSLFASTSRGFSDHVEKYKSRWGLASGRLELVSDGVVGTNSPFCAGIIEFLSGRRESKVPVSDLIQYVKRKVSESTSQTPIGNPLAGVGDEGGEFIFYRRNDQ